MDRDGDSAEDLEKQKREARVAEDVLKGMAESTAWPMPFPTLEEAKATQPGELTGLTEPRTSLPEAQYRTLVEQLPAITFMASFESGLREVYVSPQIQSVLGYTQQEWLESPKLWLDRLHPEDQERWHADFAPLVFRGDPFHGVYRFLARDGKIVWILGDARIVRDDAGTPLFVQGVGFDITDLKRTEEALREAQQALQEVASTIRETFWVLSPALDRVLYASAAFEAIWGRPIDALRGPLPGAILDRVHPQDRERVSQTFEKMRTGETEIEHRVAEPGGQARWVRSRTFPVRNEREEVVRVIAVSEDVTERKELEMQIQLAQEREIVRLRSAVQKESSPDNLVGSSEAMKRLRDLIRRVAPSNATVLITGESGTGKELVAKAIHYGGPRAKGPLVDVNCAAIPETLLEAELFGVARGVGTGVTERIGKFEQAHDGTLFLDEIGDMSPDTQAKILRALEERAFERVGGREKVRVNVRVICATNRNLQEAVRKGTFREDLYYRINPVVLEIPPLRERPGDVHELAEHFLARANRDEKRQARLSDAAKQRLGAHSWPGNVRELRHAIDQAVLFCQADTILPEDLPPAVAGRRPEPAPEARRVRINDAVQDLERRLIVQALQDSKGVKTEAARSLGTNERNLTYKMNKLGVAALSESPWVKTP